MPRLIVCFIAAFLAVVFVYTHAPVYWIALAVGVCLVMALLFLRRP